MNAAEAAVGHQQHEIARLMLASDGLDDVVDRRVARLEPLLVEVANQLRRRQPFGFRQRRSKHRCDEHLVGSGKGAREVLLKDAAARRSRARFEDRPDARLRIRCAHPGNRLGDRSRMMREIVVDGDAVGAADYFEPALDAGEKAQTLANALGADADLGCDRHRGEGVPHVVGANERHLEGAERRPAAPNLEAGHRSGRLDVVRLPVDIISGAERLDARAGGVGEAAGAGTVGADDQQTAARHQIREPAESQHDGVEVRIDVRVVELDVVDHRDVRQVLEELRRLVEEGAVVFVAFDHEVTALADTIARTALAQISCDAADQHARIDAAVCEQPPGQRRRGGLAVGPGHDDRARAPQEVLANRLGQRTVPDFPIQHLLELRVAARDRVADHDQIEIAGDVLRLVPDQSRYALGGEKVAHRWIDVLIRTADLKALALQHRGERGHRRAADTDHMDHWTAASSMMRRGRAPPTTRAVTPNGSVMAGPVVWPEGKPISTGPGKSLSRSAMTLRPVRSPAGPLQFGSSPMTTAAARARIRVCCNCSTCRSRRYGRSPTSSRNSTNPRGGANAYGVPSDASSCVSVPPSSMPLASPSRTLSSPGGDSSPI